MSQKAVKKPRRRTSDEDTDFKPPAAIKIKANNGNDIVEEPAAATPQDSSSPPPFTNGNNKVEEQQNGNNGTEKIEGEEATAESQKSEETERDDGARVTRSRSQTPLVVVAKTIIAEEKSAFNGNGTGTPDIPEEEENNSSSEDSQEAAIIDVESGDMDPLILTGDDPDPELLFDENSDLDSVKASPVPSRCQTRRSQTKSVPPPSTPKLLLTDDSNIIVAPEISQPELVLNSSVASENLSTRAEVGNSDATRLEFLESSQNSFLNSSKGEDFSKTLRKLSSRRAIRPVSEDYRKRALRSNLDGSGVKRKNGGDLDGEGHKRFKGGDSPGFLSMLTSPLSGIRNPFRTEPASSTPKLTSYKEDEIFLHDNEKQPKLVEVNDTATKRWCSIM